MSHRALERVFVRMLFDPAFVASVHDDPLQALDGLDLTDAEIENLVATDRRAWGHDPLRRLRTLRTLVDEFKASSTMLLAATRSVASLDAFFSSIEFHDAIQSRRSLAGAFAEFLDRMRAEHDPADGLLEDVLRLEATMARCRRELDRADPAETFAGPFDPARTAMLSPGHAAGRYDASVVEAVNAVERYLFEVGLMPAVALCDDAPRLAGLPEPARTRVHLLALPADGSISLMPVDDDYGALLVAFSGGPRRIEDAFGEVEGASYDDLVTMTESLLEEGVLRIH